MHRILIAALVAAATSTALAWSEAGHKIVGSIAFRQLTPDQQDKIVAILKNHPRWQQDFESKMPAELTIDTERNEWIFQQAAIWPDMARSFQGDARKEFTRGNWHYIDLPMFLTPEDQAALGGTLTENISLEPPDTEQENMNVIQVIRLARRLLADKSTPDAKKAVMLCWIMHDVGDIHQPLHSTALYSKNLFPAGDRGGNSIKTDQRQNLHAVWDQFLGQRASYRTASNRAIKLIADPEQSKAGADAATNLDEKTWLDESHALAESTAYDSEVTGYLRGYVDEKEAPPIHLTERYLKTGGGVAERRVVEAGYRLGALLNQIAQ
ncbi:MAG TPA: S1/P1 nuclease [Pirellulales bacterium]|nr:S1/P1 nuclease [Pirellulales bacterium]